MKLKTPYPSFGIDCGCKMVAKQVMAINIQVDVGCQMAIDKGVDKECQARCCEYGCGCDRVDTYDTESDWDALSDDDGDQYSNDGSDVDAAENWNDHMPDVEAKVYCVSIAYRQAYGQ